MSLINRLEGHLGPAVSLLYLFAQRKINGDIIIIELPPPPYQLTSKLKCITYHWRRNGVTEHWGTVPSVECEILTLTPSLWALHGKIETKIRWCPRLVGAVSPLVSHMYKICRFRGIVKLYCNTPVQSAVRYTVALHTSTLHSSQPDRARSADHD